MDKKREVIAILNTCRISGLEISLYTKTGKKITGKLQGSKDEDVVTINDTINDIMLDIVLTDISQVEYFGNVFKVWG